MDGMDLNAGFGKIRKSMLLIIVASIIAFIGYGAGLAPALAAQSAPSSASAASLVTAEIFIVLLMVGVIIQIYAVFNIRQGFKILKSNDPDYGIGATGALLELIGFAISAVAVVILLVGVASLVSSFSSAVSGASTSTVIGAGIAAFAGVAVLFLAFIGFLVIAGIIAFIGAILVGVGLFKIGSKYGDGLTQIGGILYIIIPLIGVILLYIGLGGVIKSGKAAGKAPQNPPGANGK